MATLLELSTIEANSTEPLVGSPPDPDVVAARDLRGRTRFAVLRRVGTIMNTPLPTDDTRTEALEELAWAQRAVQDPESATAEVFRMALATASPSATVSAILSVTDEGLDAVITPILPALAKGMHPGRR